MSCQEYGSTRPVRRSHAACRHVPRLVQEGAATHYDIGLSQRTLSLSFSCKDHPLKYKMESLSPRTDTSTPVVTHPQQYYDQHYIVIGRKPKPL
jgi:hypothetical protein